MKFHVPLSERSLGAQIELREIADGWDEWGIAAVQPLLKDAASLVDVSSNIEEIQFEVTQLANEWRFNSFGNHGLHIKLLAHDTASLINDKPPFLLVETV